MITEIGALVSIIKGLVEAAKTGRELFAKDAKQKTLESVTRTQQRLAGLAEQLFQSVSLSKMLPVWLQQHAAVNLYSEHLSDDEVKLLDLQLRNLIYLSVHDTFSGTFFRTSFAILPSVDSVIGDFRKRLLDLENQLNGIPPGDAEGWRRSWPILKVRLHDLRIEAMKLDTLAEEIHSKLVAELREAANISS